jgi:Nucleotidyl transferase AbiEii toxin, Type IV TA system
MGGTYPGSRKWPTSAWRDLLASTLDLLDTLPTPPEWSFGGGTSLMVHYDHRYSYDIDAFVGSGDVIRALSPNRNPATKALLNGRKYEYPGNYLKLVLDSGEIDFIVGGARTDRAVETWSFEGRAVPIDTPWETAVKKMFYRPSTFKVRDVFDLAVVVERHPEELRAGMSEIDDRLQRLLDRIDALRPVYATLAADDVSPTEGGQRYMSSDAVENVFAFLRDYQRRADGDERQRKS